MPNTILNTGTTNGVDHPTLAYTEGVKHINGRLDNSIVPPIQGHEVEYGSVNGRITEALPQPVTGERRYTGRRTDHSSPAIVNPAFKVEETVTSVFTKNYKNSVAPSQQMGTSPKTRVVGTEAAHLTLDELIASGAVVPVAPIERPMVPVAPVVPVNSIEQPVGPIVTAVVEPGTIAAANVVESAADEAVDAMFDGSDAYKNVLEAEAAKLVAEAIVAESAAKSEVIELESSDDGTDLKVDEIAEGETTESKVSKSKKSKK